MEGRKESLAPLSLREDWIKLKKDNQGSRNVQGWIEGAAKEEA